MTALPAYVQVGREPRVFKCVDDAFGLVFDKDLGLAFDQHFDYRFEQDFNQPPLSRWDVSVALAPAESQPAIITAPTFDHNPTRNGRFT